MLIPASPSTLPLHLFPVPAAPKPSNSHSNHIISSEFPFFLTLLACVASFSFADLTPTNPPKARQSCDET